MNWTSRTLPSLSFKKHQSTLKIMVPSLGSGNVPLKRVVSACCVYCFVCDHPFYSDALFLCNDCCQPANRSAWHHSWEDCSLWLAWCLKPYMKIHFKCPLKTHKTSILTWGLLSCRVLLISSLYGPFSLCVIKDNTNKISVNMEAVWILPQKKSSIPSPTVNNLHQKIFFF